MENRNKERHNLELPLSIVWKDESGRPMRARGKTTDVSPSGAFIVCDRPIEEGCAIDLQLDLPVTVAGASRGPISVTAKVLRGVAQSDRDEFYGHAVIFDHFRFVGL